MIIILKLHLLNKFNKQSNYFALLNLENTVNNLVPTILDL